MKEKTLLKRMRVIFASSFGFKTTYIDFFNISHFSLSLTTAFDVALSFLVDSLLLFFRAKGWIMYGMDSKLKLGEQLKTSEQYKQLGDL